ncbi:hypothetical protein EV361DRAFT_203834 [Lentinula raphanica]|uniref:Uncharacterized protein n=1 Tax=Lentinula raphanica TaxID=153919 RepID=A0AA38UEH9_9AGAR|nr:hypothetical protein C8R42DRAFT_269433 [Lentinula raphanica]KAJ3762599.1 hypothetical protein EV360DRAFT_79137 [Lentinula raphanica]KAJ3820875.1 hypothetical protein F5880DRAFT_1585538 [Lentinula raphanica]KAJ3838782.1 hypothetical protein F5878DRAFT_618590 [Lentinula raphanica]KAJ3971662.1 hypothetical protein EV361DRAFT_203834 [Lentinula raphanica]
MSFSGEQHRPGMRRKSSAQNLLSSFKSPPTSSTPQPAPLTVSSAAAAAYTGPPGAPTPVSSTPFAKEWDAQSLHAESVGTSTPALGTSDEYLRDLVQKRILTLTYIRNIHEGRSHWFHTIYISRTDLDRVFNNVEMKKRTTRFLILGMSLGNLLDVPQPQDFLRGLLNTLLEYDQAKEETEKPKMRQPRRLFRGKLGGKRPGVMSEYSASYTETVESYLVNPHTPFPLDYHQTLLTLLDIVSEVYNKISKLIGPSPIPHAAQHMMGPLGLLIPHPGVSYLFTDGPQSAFSGTMSPNLSQHSYPSTYPPESDPHISGSLWSIANGGLSTTAGFSFGAGPLPAWSSSLGEMVLKIDNKFKKLTSILLKELDQFARTGIKEELASLDPLLRNIKMPDLEAAGLANFD